MRVSYISTHTHHAGCAPRIHIQFSAIQGSLARRRGIVRLTVCPCVLFNNYINNNNNNNICTFGKQSVHIDRESTFFVFLYVLCVCNALEPLIKQGDRVSGPIIGSSNFPLWMSAADAAMKSCCFYDARYFASVPCNWDVRVS